MDLIADILLASGALGAGFYCFVLGRRLNRFNNLEKGVGGAVAVLSAQVDDLTKTLAAAQATAADSAETLNDTTQRATEMARRLELQMAALHDVAPQEAGGSAAGREPPISPVTSVQAAPQEPGEPMFARRSGIVRQ